MKRSSEALSDVVQKAGTGKAETHGSRGPDRERGEMKALMKAVLIEDSPTDARLLIRELKTAELDIEVRRVDSKTGFLEAMGDALPDVILSDFSVPGFEGDESLELRNAHFATIPFIFVTGTVGEDVATELLKRGATDFVLKDHLERLPAVILRATSPDPRTEVTGSDRKDVHMVEALAEIMTLLMRPDSGHPDYERVLSLLGTSASVDRVRLQALRKRDGALVCVLMAEWTERDLGEPHSEPGFEIDVEGNGLMPWVNHLSTGRPVETTTMESPEPAASYFRSQRIVSFLAMPILIAGRLWGFVRFDSCSEVRGWTDVERRLLRAAAEALAADLSLEQFEDRLRESEDRFRRLTDNARDLIFRYQLHPTQKLEYVNRICEEMTGYSQEEFAELDPLGNYLLVHPDDRRAVEEWVRGKDDRVIEARWIRKDGSIIWTEQQVLHVRDQGVAAIEGIVRDITDRKRIESDLRALVENSPDGITRMDRDLRYVYVNGTVERWTQLPREQIIGRTISEVMGLPEGPPPPEIEEFLREVFETGRPKTVERRWESPMGTLLLELKLIPEGPADGPPETILSISRDITTRKVVEQRLEQSLAEVRKADRERRTLLSRWIRSHEDERGRLAAELNDDAIQVIAAVGLRLRILQMSAPAVDPDDIQEALGTVESAITRMRAMIFNLRPPALDKDGLVLTVRNLLERVSREQIVTQLTHRLEEEPPSDMRMLLYRIIQEAVENTVKHARASTLEVEVADQEGGYYLKVVDDGVGFTTPETGVARVQPLGMDEMRQRAELSGGWLKVQSSRGQGTKLECWVPSVLIARGA